MPARFNFLLISLTLVAGLLAGFAASTLAYRYRLLRVPHEGLVHRMDQELKLTPAQHEQVIEVMQSSRLKMQQMHNDFQRQRHELLKQTYAQIRAILTPEQQKEFDRSFILEQGPGWGHHHGRP